MRGQLRRASRRNCRQVAELRSQSAKHRRGGLLNLVGDQSFRWSISETFATQALKGQLCRHISALRTQIAGVLHGRPQVGCISFGTWMSKPLLNDPFALLSNKASVEGVPFDAGSLGRLPVVPNGRSPSGSANECKFS
jgi:hypothetical protein